MRSGTPPVLAVVQDDPTELFGLLEQRFGREYVVEVATSTAAFAEVATQLAAERRRIAVVVADRIVGGQPIIPTLAELREVHPDVIRCLLLPFGDPAAGEEIVAAITVGDVDRYLSVPWPSVDIGLYPVVTDLLAEWWRTTSPPGALRTLVRLVAPPLSPRTHEMRDLLDRNRIPAQLLDRDSDVARELRARAGEPVGAEDILVELPDGGVLVNPSNRTVADRLGARTTPTSDAADVVVVGGGPSGLAAAVYAASEGRRTVVVERAALGGQAGTSSSIRNYPGFPHGVSGTELAVRASEQGWLFGVEFVNTNAVEHIVSAPDGRHSVLLADGSAVTTGAVVLAIGVEYRRLSVAGVDRLLGAGVFYGAARAEAPGLAGRRAFLVGAGNSAGQAAVHLARYAMQVTLVVRRASLAATMSEYLIQQIERTPNIAVQLETEVARAEGQHRLESLDLLSGGRITTVAADGLFILIGAEPRTGWLPDAVLRDDHGFVLTGADLPADRRSLPYETSLPGVFAVGDVRSGSVKRVASAIGDGAVCISSVHRRLDEGPPQRRAEAVS